MARIFEHSDELICRLQNFLDKLIYEAKIENEVGLEFDNSKSGNTSKQICFRITTPESNRNDVTKKLKIRFDFRGIDIINTKQKHCIKFCDLKSNINVLILIKPTSSKRTSIDPFESMVACLIAMPCITTPTSVEEMDSLIIEMLQHKDLISNYPTNVFNNFKKNYTPLLQAISAARVIKKNIPHIQPDEIFITGASYPDEIKFFDISHLGMKNYNSSDIIVRYDDFYHCFSLKKSDDKNNLPTLINKSIDVLFDKETNTEIEKQTNIFFNKIITSNSKHKPHSNGWKEYIHKIDNKIINNASKGNESHFNYIYRNMLNLSENDIMDIINMVFKIDLKIKITNVSFNFSLVTGQGVFNKDIHIWEGELIELNDFNRLINKLLLNGKFSIKPAKHKKQCFEKDAPAFKIFFDIFIGDLCILYLEIRYKGSFSIQPQLTAYLSNDLKDFNKKFKG